MNNFSINKSPLLSHLGISWLFKDCHILLAQKKLLASFVKNRLNWSNAVSKCSNPSKVTLDTFPEAVKICSLFITHK